MNTQEETEKDNGKYLTYAKGLARFNDDRKAADDLCPSSPS